MRGMSDELEETGNVLDLGALRIAHGRATGKAVNCRHQRLLYSPKERSVWCEDCKSTVDNFDAFCRLVDNFAHAVAKIERREKAVRDAEEKALISIAAKRLDDAWRTRKMLPCCPSCGVGLRPEDFKSGRGWGSRKYDEAMRQKKEAP